MDIDELFVYFGEQLEIIQQRTEWQKKLYQQFVEQFKNMSDEEMQKLKDFERKKNEERRRNSKVKL